jgi:hypothetical protein
MKPLVRALTAVLGFTCLSVANGTSAGACRYICGGTIHETYAGELGTGPRELWTEHRPTVRLPTRGSTLPTRGSEEWTRESGGFDPRVGGVDPRVGAGDLAHDAADPNAGAWDPQVPSSDPRVRSVDPTGDAVDPRGGSAATRVGLGPRPAPAMAGRVRSWRSGNEVLIAPEWMRLPTSQASAAINW